MEPHRAAKTIGTSLDAQVALRLPDPDRVALEALGEGLEDLLVVSALALSEGELAVAVTAHDGAKCPRCWNRKGGHGTGEDVALCIRCAAVVA
jgi:isoleucyl-tRNA synthetase